MSETSAPAQVPAHAPQTVLPPDRTARRRERADAQRAKNTERGPIFPSTVPWLAVVVFVAISIGGAWLVALPLWTSGEGLMHPLFTLIALAMMYTPALATLVVVLWVRRPPNIPRFLGLSPIRPAGRTWLFIAVGAVGFWVLAYASMLLGQAMGLIRLDLTGVSAITATIEATGAPAVAPVDVSVIVLVNLITLPFITVVNCFAAFGEEVGWRGWLLPALRPLGTWPALLISGAIWGVWHAPLILLGYNYQRSDLAGVGFMVVFCVLVGILIGWLRLRSASVWPAVVAHAALNTAVSAFLIFVDARDLPAGPWGSLLGWPGWILLALAAVVLLVTGQFRKQPAPGLTLAEAAQPTAPEHSADAAVPRAG
ncbi:CPBP family intramembrane glutamic endopeptidase [Agromyces aerolatus]|uniref:CPBP family intramembrane glutamic endopeptidase n=1 Tax=Agromyces sp. LY-1074 TaxID=3074080 RepID=UPI002856A93C|nr:MULTISPECIES: type II CAAX endopeptidase family protein [unclassified Agromyces]MDR5701071.1 type II CAAX endopeptidase family protein [Agromyces sp. LY-1074]MDR5707711.1 type II CAAX endopeptidase family protein [Agromyces sp. LY-1358]